jgi:hypothetical protein
MRRAQQRYPGSIDGMIVEELIRRIQQGDASAEYIFKQSNRTSRWIVTYAEVEYLVVYDKVRQQIATFLPPERIPLERKLKGAR